MWKKSSVGNTWLEKKSPEWKWARSNILFAILWTARLCTITHPLSYLPTLTRSVPSISNILVGFLVTSTTRLLQYSRIRTDTYSHIKHKLEWDENNTLRLGRCCMLLFFRKAEKSEYRWLCHNTNQKRWLKAFFNLNLFLDANVRVSHKVCKQENFLTNVLKIDIVFLIQLYSCNGGMSCSKVLFLMRWTP